MHQSLFQKIIVLALIMLVLCVGLFMVNNLVQERQKYRDTVVQDFAKGLAGRQKIATPTLHMQCKDTWRERGLGTTYASEGNYAVHAIADSAQLNVVAAIEPRTRGIYSVNTYQLKATLEANWASPLFVRVQPAQAGAGRTTACAAPLLHLLFGDLRGIRDMTVKVNGKAMLTESMTSDSKELGLRVRLPRMDMKGDDALKIEVAFNLLGMESLELVPSAAKNVMAVSANWAHPSFTGSLPDRREISSEQFSASWNLQTASADPIHIGFVDPVNAYSQTDRAIKYGLLFILLTFVAVGLFEVTKKLQVHPIQYLLVGSAVTIFFLLLLSLSEHMRFPIAYALAATACVGLLTFYASHILGGMLRGTPFGGLMTVLYGMIYVLLSLEQTALLIGTLALFGALTAVIVLTRNVNWYAAGKG